MTATTWLPLIEKAQRGLKWLFALVLGLAIVLSCLFGISSSYATQGVGITPAGTLVSIGGMGGNAFGTITCPAGQLVTGLNFWNAAESSSLDGRALQLRCSTITLSGTSVNVNYAANSAVGGPQGGNEYTNNCPAGQVLTGVDAQATTWPVLGWLRLYCSPVSYDTGLQRVVIAGAPIDPSTGILGPSFAYGGTYYNRVVANTGSAIGGFSGRSGDGLDLVTFDAYSITQARLTLTAVVTGGSALPSEFTLSAVDSNGVISTLPSGQLSVMTPSNYTLSTTNIPANYVLTSITGCSNPVNLADGSSASCQFNFLYSPPLGGAVLLDSLGTGTPGTGISDVTVRLYNSTGTLVSTTTTDANGNYTFSGQSAGIFYIAVDAPTTGAAVAEQTYATTGVGNTGTAGGSGYGPICTEDTPTYTAQTGATPSAWNAKTTTYCFGGAEGAVANDNSVTTLVNKEHITRINSTEGGNVTGVNFAFSYNVVTNTNDSGQGSLRQFITNANTLSGANSMRFVPAVVTNQSSGASSWWRTTLASVLPIITGANAASTTIDGTAYSNVNGSTLLTPNNVTLGDTTTQVGRITTALSGLAAPQFEVRGVGAASDTLSLGASTITVRRMGFHFGRVALNVGAADIILRENVFGSIINTFADTGAALRSDSNIYSNDPSVTSVTGFTIQNNLIGFANNAGINLNRVSFTNLTISDNEINGNNLTSVNPDGLQFVGSTTNGTSSINHNLIINNRNKGIELLNTNADMSIINNTIIGNGGAGIGVHKTNSTLLLIQNNRILNNSGAGIVLPNNTNLNGANQITQNEFGGNAGNAIDLADNGVSLNTTVCTNTSGASSANTGLARPTLSGITLIGSTLTVQGSMCNTGTFTIEVYAAAAGTGDTGSDGFAAGEGTTYLGSLTSQTGGEFYGTISGVTGVSSGSAISVIAIRTATGGVGVVGDTSEFSRNLTVTNPNWGRDPDSYLTLNASGGAQHYIIDTLRLGATEVGSVDGSPVVPYAPLNLNTGGSDGVVSFPQLTPDNTTYAVQVTATNQTGAAATLVGWIDFNRDGVFTASEGVSVSVPTGSNNATFTLNWTGVNNLFSSVLATRIGPTYSRFRLSTNTTLTTSTPAGLMTNGEVEDYGGTGVLEIVGRNILGTVYSDVNRNGILDSTETGSGETLYAKLTAATGTTCSGPATQVVAVNTTTGAYALNGVPPGSYCVVVDTNNTLSDITPNLPSGWTFTDGIPGFRVVTLTANSDMPNINFGINNDLITNVQVFYDTGSGGGTAYDALKQSGEVGVVTTITATGNAGSATYTTAGDGTLALALTSAVTNGSGNITFTVTVPSTAISVTKGVTTVTDSAPATQTTTITVSVASLSGGGSMRFGLAPIAQLLPDNIQNGSPDSTVFHPHQFKVSSAGTLTLSIASQTASPSNTGWAQAFYTDPGCTGDISGASTLISGPVTIGAGGSTYCFINRVSIPEAAASGAQLLQTVNAQFSYGSTGISSSLNVQDSTVVGDKSKLILVKTVDKTTAKSGSGEVLTYTVAYTNLDIGTMDPVIINDSVPQMTTLVSGSPVCVTPLPAGISCAVNHNASTGGITWTLTGGLLPSGSGSVRYQVTIN